MAERVRVDMLVDDIDAFVTEAIRFGFMRVEPRKRWTKSEKKEAVRFAIEQIVKLHFDSFG